MSIVHYVLAMRLPCNSGRYSNTREDRRSIEVIPPNVLQLHDATKNLDKDLVLKILRKGADPRPRNRYGDTVLHLAFKRIYNQSSALQGKITKVLEVYLDCGINVNQRNTAGRTALSLAIANRLEKVIKFLLRRGARFDVVDERGNTCLHFLIKNEFERFAKICSPCLPFAKERAHKPDENFVSWLLAQIKSVEYKNHRGETPLSLAARRNLLHVVLFLLKHTKHACFVDNRGKTIFHIFLESIDRFNSYGQLREGIPTFCYEKKYVIDIAKTMLQKGFSVDAADKNGDSPIIIAMRTKQMEVAQMMLEQPIRSMKKEIDGLMLVQMAVVNKDLRILRCLKDNDVDFGILYRGNNLLHLLSTNNDRQVDTRTYEIIVDLLVNVGCDVNARNDDSLTPLHLASQAGLYTVIKRLIEHGANVHSRELTERRFTPLHQAVDNNRMGVIEVLVNAGADINARTVSGQTPLHLAMLYESKMAATLLKLGAHVDVLDDEGRDPFCDAISYHNITAMKELLNFGVDINEHKFYQEIKSLSEVGVVMSTMIEHWMKLQAAKLPATDCYRYETVDRRFQQTYKECVNEAESLKDCLFNDGTSMYELLHMNPNRRCNFVAARNMKDSLLSPKMKNLFPRYHTLIKACYHETTARYSLLEPAKCAWYELTRIGLPDACVDRILFYLNNMTLRIMVDGVEDMSLRQGSYDSCR